MSTRAGTTPIDDVVVVGARCAGAAVAMLLARAGLRVRVVDRATDIGDVVSGHMVKSPGAARLADWGLLDDVLATGCPPMRTATLWIAGEPYAAPPLPETTAPHIAPRRWALDNVLLDAARDAGATVDLGRAVTGVVREGGRVVGVETPAGEIRARLVVGADGRSSRVARLVGAQAYWYVAPATYSYYTYWAGTRVDALHAHLGPGLFGGVFPTNDDLALAFVQAPRAGFAEAHRDPHEAYASLVAAAPALADLLAGGRIVERLRGLGDLPNFLRTSAGPGWVLAGDAGHHKDPLIARGIADAFRDADLIADAVAAGWDGELDDACLDYQRRRDLAARPLAEANATLARLEGSVGELAAGWGSLVAMENDLDPGLVADAPPAQRQPASGTVARGGVPAR